MFGVGDATYTEAAIFRAINGEFTGEYVAACAQNTCGYLGKN